MQQQSTTEQSHQLRRDAKERNPETVTKLWMGWTTSRIHPSSFFYYIRSTTNISVLIPLASITTGGQTPRASGLQDTRLRMNVKGKACSVEAKGESGGEHMRSCATWGQLGRCPSPRWLRDPKAVVERPQKGYFCSLIGLNHGSW